MSWRREFSKIRRFMSRVNETDDLEEEIRSHLKMEEQENLEAGMPQAEAHGAALRQFGNVTRAQEQSRDMWQWNSLETLFNDLRFGLRQFRRNPGFTTVAVLTFALGIGATTAIFSVVNSVLLRPLPFKDPARLVQCFETEEAPGTFPLSGADYLDWQAQNRTLAATSLYSYPVSMNASGVSEPEPAAVIKTQANFFHVLGVEPLRGRTFANGEDIAGKNRVAILSYGFWQQHFGGANVIGKPVVLDDESYTIVGVMPRWFNFQNAADIWIPVDMSPKELGPRGNHSWSAIARLKSGIPLGRARGELLAISERLEKQYPDSNDKVHAILTPLYDTLTNDSKTPLLILLGAVTLVLVVACVNVANLQLARASTRHREMAVRASLGAGRLRLVRQMLTESILLALTGAALGILGAWWCVRLLESAKTIPIPRANPVQVDGAVLLFAVSMSILAGVLFGLAPALQSSDLGLNEELKAGSQSVLSAARSRWALRDALIVAEICITFALLVGAGLLLRSFAHLRSANIGVDAHNVLTTSINLPEAKYGTIAARRRFFGQLMDRMEATPGIECAAVSTEIPLQGGSNGYIHVEGETQSGAHDSAGCMELHHTRLLPNLGYSLHRWKELRSPRLRPDGCLHTEIVRHVQGSLSRGNPDENSSGPSIRFGDQPNNGEDFLAESEPDWPLIQLERCKSDHHRRRGRCEGIWNTDEDNTGGLFPPPAYSCRLWLCPSDSEDPDAAYRCARHDSQPGSRTG